MIRRFVCCLLLSPAMLPACTAVLGMERAELEDEVEGSGGSPVTLRSTSVCDEVSPSCASCLTTSCNNQRGACLEDQTCREALDAYGKCLGLDCVDDDNPGSCAEQRLSLHSTSQLAQALGTCLRTCFTDCTPGAVAQKCELYCACMRAHCSAEPYDRFSWTDQESCIRACREDLSAGRAECQWQHCEYAPLSAHHCLHAAGDPADDPCSRMPQTSTCLVGQERGHPCKDTQPCCAGLRCNGAVCGE